jgi:hypothetical protein
MKKIFLVLLAGVAVGMLLSTEKGSETRKKLAKGLGDIKDKALDEVNNLRDKSKSLLAKGKERVQSATQDW